MDLGVILRADLPGEVQRFAGAEDELPKTVHITYQSPPEEEGERVRFRLIYHGPLPAETRHSRTKEKHAVRRYLHPQLRELWNTNPYLKRLVEDGRMEERANQFPRICGYRFLPVVGGHWNLAVSVNIVFLRRDDPVGLVNSGGDIDNRIKVFFDGLRMPHRLEEIPKEHHTPEADEDPFFLSDGGRQVNHRDQSNHRSVIDSETSRRARKRRLHCFRNRNLSPR